MLSVLPWPSIHMVRHLLEFWKLSEPSIIILLYKGLFAFNHSNAFRTRILRTLNMFGVPLWQILWNVIPIAAARIEFISGYIPSQAAVVWLYNRPSLEKAYRCMRQENILPQASVPATWDTTTPEASCLHSPSRGQTLGDYRIWELFHNLYIGLLYDCLKCQADEATCLDRGRDVDDVLGALVDDNSEWKTVDRALCRSQVFRAQAAQIRMANDALLLRSINSAIAASITSWAGAFINKSFRAADLGRRMRWKHVFLRLQRG